MLAHRQDLLHVHYGDETFALLIEAVETLLIPVTRQRRHTSEHVGTDMYGQEKERKKERKRERDKVCVRERKVKGEYV